MGGFTEMEEKVTDKVTSQLKPKIKEIQLQAKVDIKNAVETEITNVDIPNLIKNEVQNALPKIKTPEGNEASINDAIKNKIKEIDIPTLIREEVKLAVKSLEKDESGQEEESAGDPGMGEPR